MRNSKRSAEQREQQASEMGIKSLRRLGSFGGILAMLACYGTLATVALLSLVGITVDLDEGLLVKIISVFLVLAFVGTALSWRNHRNFGPLAITSVAVALLLSVFYGHYNAWLEGSGFAGLFIASVWDIRLKKQACMAKGGTC